MFKVKLKSILAAALCCVLTVSVLQGVPQPATTVQAASSAPIITVDTATKRGDLSPYTLGANHRHGYGGFGMYDIENNTVYADFLEKTKQANLGVVRYPGGTIANLFTWKDSIGPLETRNNVVLGNSFESVFPSYGLDEHMQYTEAIGAKVIYMLAEASETPESAADLVEYLNCAVGENPNGGTDWAAVRAENGHAEPYGVTHFELGNEMNLGNQTYWMSNPSIYGETNNAKRYALGDTVQMTNHMMRKYGTWKDNVSTGEASQKFYSRYNPVVEGTETIYVDSVEWTQVDSLEDADADATVYLFDYKTGEVTFGDGTNGKIPQKGAKITANYQHKHAGYLEYYEAMKAVDPEIKLYTCMSESLDFLDLTKCDGIVNHNYIPLPSGIKTARAMHDQYMSVADQLVAKNATNDSVAKEKSKRNDFISAVTEFGTIPIPQVYSVNSADIYRDEARSLSRGLGFATTYIGSARTEMDIHVHQAYTAYSFGGGATLPNADNVYNSLYAFDPDSPGTTIESASALAYKVIGNGVGDSVRDSWIENNIPVYGAATYNALCVLATQDDENGDLYLLVLNRSPSKDIGATVDLKGYEISSAAQISTLNGDDITSCNTPSHPNDVKITQSTRALGIGHTGFYYNFPAHSLVSIKLSGKSAEAFQAVNEKNTFENETLGETPAHYTVFSGTGVVAVDPQDADNQVLQVTRTDTNAQIKTTLSGTDTATGYSDIVKVSYRLKAASDTDGRIDISVRGNTSEVTNLAFDKGYVKTGGMVRANYEKDKWYTVELLINHKANTLSMYLDGKYLNSKTTYNQAVSKPLDYLIIDAEDANATFYIDDVLVQTCSVAVESALTQVDLMTLTTEPGVPPALPSTVAGRYNTGETTELPVVWDAVDPSAYQTYGSFTVNGKVVGYDWTATCTVTVCDPPKEETPPASTPENKPAQGGGTNKPVVKTPTNGTAKVGKKTILYKSGKKVTGTKVVAVGKKTYAVVKGYVATGKTRVVKISKTKSYVVNKYGIVQKSSKNKLVKVGKKSYIVNKYGVIQKNNKNNKLVKIGKKSYVVSKYGVVYKSKKKVKVGKKYYKINKYGVATKRK